MASNGESDVTGTDSLSDGFSEEESDLDSNSTSFTRALAEMAARGNSGGLFPYTESEESSSSDESVLNVHPNFIPPAIVLGHNSKDSFESTGTASDNDELSIEETSLDKYPNCSTWTPEWTKEGTIDGEGPNYDGDNFGEDTVLGIHSHFLASTLDMAAKCSTGPVYDAEESSVEKIEEISMNNGTVERFVQREGCETEDNKWEPEEYQNLPNLGARFEEDHKERNGQKHKMTAGATEDDGGKKPKLSGNKSEEGAAMELANDRKVPEDENENPGGF